MKSMKLDYFLLPALVLVSAMFGCGEDAAGPTGNRIAGIITFVNKTFYQNGSNGYYAVALYPNEADPFCKQPLRKDTIDPYTRDTLYYSYEMSNVGTGTYYVGVAWISSVPGPVPTKVLGTYGCGEKNMDSCRNYIRIEIPNYAGAGTINFTSQTNHGANINNRCP
jgi:hypothetical protein